MKTMTLTLLAAGALLAGCSGEAEPADPPTSEDALTTSETAPTTDAAPTTEPPPDDVVETSSAPDDVSETTEAAGPPELPEEATEDSEAGATAFANYYIDVINYTSTNPETGLLEELATSGCETCSNFASAVADSVNPEITSSGNIFESSTSVAAHYPADSEANVRVTVHQVGQEYSDSDGNVVDSIDDQDAVMAFTLTWDDNWIVEDLRIEQL